MIKKVPGLKPGDFFFLIQIPHMVNLLPLLR